VSPQDRYLRDLERRLPYALGLRGRVLAEVREHLRDGGDEALARFGPVEELAPELTAELRVRAAARASWLVPGLLAVFVFPLYVIPENTLPPAPWVSKPDYLAWKQHVAVAAWLIAIGFGLLAFAIGRLRPRLAVAPLACSAAALAVAVVFGSVVAVQWIDAVPGTSAAITYAGIATAILLVAAVAFLAVEAGRSALPQSRNQLASD
jgi:hypothetical protein